LTENRYHYHRYYNPLRAIAALIDSYDSWTFQRGFEIEAKLQHEVDAANRVVGHRPSLLQWPEDGGHQQSDSAIFQELAGCKVLRSCLRVKNFRRGSGIDTTKLLLPISVLNCSFQSYYFVSVDSGE